jgi:tape measure domain-containing protein
VNSAGVAQANIQLAQLEQTSRRAESAAGRLRTSFSLHDAAAGKLGLSYSKLIQLTGAAAAGIGLVGVAMKSIQDAAKVESLEVGFEGLLGSAGAAKKMMEDLRSVATKIPVDFERMAEQAKFMKAMGFESGEIITNIRTIGDATAALGGGVNMFERITLALGQMRQKGHTASQEMRQLADANIPAWELLAKTLNITVPEAQRRVERGLVNSEVAIKAILDGMDAKYKGFGERQAKTLLGAFQLLKNQIKFIMVDAGDELIQGLDLTKFVQNVTKFGKVFGAVVVDVVRALMGLEPRFQAVHGAVEKVLAVIQVLVDLFKIWVAIKIVTTVEDMAKGAILFARSMSSASIAGRPLLTTVLAVGVALASWSLGKTLFEQFESVRNAAISVITVIAKAKNMLDGPSETTKADWQLLMQNRQKYGQQTGDVFTAVEQLRANGLIGPGAPRQLFNAKTYAINREGTLSDKDQALLDLRTSQYGDSPGLAQTDMVPFILDYLKQQTIKDMNAELGGGNADFSKFAAAFGKNLADTVHIAAGNMTETMKTAFGGLVPDGLSGELKSLTDAYEQLTNTKKKDDAENKGRVLDDEKQLVGIKGLISQLKLQRETMGLTTFERERQLAVQKVTMMLDSTSIKDKQKWIDLVKKEVTLNYQLQAQHDIQQRLDERTRDSQMNGLYGEALEKEKAYRDLVNKALQEHIPLDAQYLAGIRAQSDALVENKRAWEKVWAVAGDVGQAFEDAFMNAITNAKDLKSTLLDLAKAIESTILKNLIVKPLGDNLTSYLGQGLGALMGLKLPNSGPGTFGRAGPPITGTSDLTYTQPIITSADGNVFTRPSVSVFGEAGPEGIFPLARGANGQLGVQAVGGGGGGGGRGDVHITMNISTPDADSFRRSRRQVSQAVKASMGGR